MPAAPPADAIASLLGPSTRITRRVDIYEEDSTTPFVLDAKIIDGGVSVDGARDERRSFDIVLENIDGSLDNYPGGFWYDKIVKMYRGIEWDGISASNLRLGLDPLYALDLDGTAGTYASTPNGSVGEEGGDWIGLYGSGAGSRGYHMPRGGPGATDINALADVTVGTTNLSPHQWDDDTGEARALQKPDLSGSGRVAGCWYTPNSAAPGVVTLTFGAAFDGYLHTYHLDWDSVIRRAQVWVTDGIGTRAVPLDFSYWGGRWAHFPITVGAGGTVTISMKSRGANNAVISGLYLDQNDAGVEPTARTVVDDIDVRAYDVTADDWTGTDAQGQNLVSKWGDTGDQHGWALYLNPSGELSFAITTDGSGATVSIGAAALGGVDGQRIEGVRATRVKSSGLTTLYKMVDDAWVSLGTAILAAGSAIFASSAPMGVGAALAADRAYFTGTIGRVEVRKGIDGTVAASPDFDKAALVGQTSYTDDQGNEWTLNGNAAIVDTGLDFADGYLATSDSTGHNLLSGKLYLAAKLSADDWTPAAIQTIMSKWNPTGNQRAWKFSILTDGKLRLSVSTNGTNELNLDSTVATGFTNSAVQWIAVDLDIDNGALGKTANFLTSTDGIVYTPLGDPVISTTLGAANLADSNAPIRIGSATDAEFFVGNIYNAQIADDLRVIADLDFTSLENGTQAVVDPNTGYAYSFNGDGVSIEGGLPEVKTWETQLGEFLIDRIDTQHFPHTASANGRDYTKRLIEDEFGYATMFPEGEPIEEVIRTIALNGGITKFIFPYTGQTLGRDFLFEGQTTRWAACKEIATAYGYELFFDNQGYMVMREFQDPLSSPVAFTFETGEFGTLASYTKSASDTRIYNRIVVKNESTEVSPMVAVAENHEPSSPTSIENLGRTKTYNYSSAFFTSLEQMQDVADDLLKIHALESFDISLESIVIPWLEATEIVEFLDPNPNPGDPTRFLLTNFNIPMSLGAMSLNSKRVTVVG